MQTIKFFRNVLVNGEHYDAGSVAELADDVAKSVIKIGKAKLHKEGDDPEGLTPVGKGKFVAQQNVNGLGQILGLNVKETVAFLKEKYDTKLSRGVDVVDGDLFHKIVSEHTVSVADLAEQLKKTVPETLDILEANKAGVGDNVEARVSKDLVEELLKEFIKS